MNGWRKGFADVVAAIQGTLADAANAGSMSAAEFLKLAGLPTSAVPTARLVNTTAPLTGGGDLTADRTLAISAADSVNPGSLAAVDFVKLATVPTGMGIPCFVRSAIVDFTTPSAGNVIVPAVPGKYFSLLAGKFVFTTMTGTATGNASGTMSGATGLASGTVTFFTSTSFNNMVAIGPPIASGVSFAAGGSATTQKMLVNTAGTFDVVTPATGTGGFTAQGYYTFFGTYI